MIYQCPQSLSVPAALSNRDLENSRTAHRSDVVLKPTGRSESICACSRHKVLPDRIQVLEFRLAPRIGTINPVFGGFEFYCGMGDVSAGPGIGMQRRQGG